MRWFTALGFVLFAGCTTRVAAGSFPTTGVVLMQVRQTDWTPRQLELMDAELEVLHAFGPTFLRVSSGGDLLLNRGTGECGAWAGAQAGDDINVNPGCAETDGQFRGLVGHEVGHWLGLAHVPSTHLPVNMMNPQVFLDSTGTPTEADLAAYTAGVHATKTR